MRPHHCQSHSSPVRAACNQWYLPSSQKLPSGAMTQELPPGLGVQVVKAGVPVIFFTRQVR